MKRRFVPKIRVECNPWAFKIDISEMYYKYIKNDFQVICKKNFNLMSFYRYKLVFIVNQNENL